MMNLFVSVGIAGPSYICNKSLNVRWELTMAFGDLPTACACRRIVANISRRVS